MHSYFKLAGKVYNNGTLACLGATVVWEMYRMFQLDQKVKKKELEFRGTPASDWDNMLLQLCIWTTTRDIQNITHRHLTYSVLWPLAACGFVWQWAMHQTGALPSEVSLFKLNTVWNDDLKLQYNKQEEGKIRVTMKKPK